MKITLRKITGENIEEQIDVTVVINDTSNPSQASLEFVDLTSEEQAVITAFTNLVKAKTS